MPAYRFCRPDDIPLLVQAIDRCYGVHFPGMPSMTVAAFRDEMKALGVWPSNCVLARQGEEPIAVLVGTKRPDAVLVSRIGVLPGHQRQGHGRHLLTSLGQKLAVLGPERLIAEVPEAMPEVAAFFRAAGYRAERRFVDWQRPPAPVAAVPDELAIPVSLDELVAQELLAEEADVAWERRAETLNGRKDALQGIAIATPERVEAWALCFPNDADGTLDLLAVGCRDAGRRALFLDLLVRWLAGRESVSLRLPKLGEDELPADLLAGLGFVPGAAYLRYAATATPA